MRVQVGFERSSGYKAPPTEMTAVRFLSGVRAQMLLQVTGLLKALITHTAPEKPTTDYSKNICKRAARDPNPQKNEEARLDEMSERPEETQRQKGCHTL